MNTVSAEKKLSQFNNALLECDELYHGVAKFFGLPDCAFWILYSLRTNEEGLTLSQLCELVYQPKQTVHSALGKLTDGGFIDVKDPQRRRNRQVVLTPRGCDLCVITVDKVMAAEEAALSALSDEEHHQLISLYQKYTAALRKSLAVMR